MLSIASEYFCKAVAPSVSVSLVFSVVVISLRPLNAPKGVSDYHGLESEALISDLLAQEGSCRELLPK